MGSAGAARINFKPSPFYEIKHFVSPIVQCPEAPTQNDRKNATLFVNLSAEQVEQLKGAKHQLRLFCTTVEAHAASLSGRNPATVEFPLTCEARVNNHTLSTNLRGSKKNVGRVPPPNLNKDGMLALRDGRPNRIDLTYTNAPKRHVLVAAICEITTVEILVERLKSQQFRTKDDVLSRMRREAEDDDIEAGAATMSLKCPFSYMRIATPCRSIHCSHVQCFDAYSFFSVNEQTPSWACPVCHKNIKVEELIMDGYVDDILKRVPQDEDSVVVEPDGSWHTSDGKVSSAGTAHATPAAEGTPLQERLLNSNDEDVKPGAGHGKSNGTRTPMDEIVLLDSPSPPPQSAASEAAQAPAAAAPAAGAPAPAAASAAPMVNGGSAPAARNGSSSSVTAPHKAPRAAALAALPERIELLSSSTNTSARQSPAVAANDVIDLTLDSDDEAEPSVPTRPVARNGNHVHASHASHGGSSSSSSSAGPSHQGFAQFAPTPHRTGPFAAAMARAEATPEDEQIRRPGKRPRTDASEIPTPSDPRLANGRRAAGQSTAPVPSSYLDVGANGTGGREAGSTTANGAETAAPRGGDEAEDAWMDNADATEHEQYLNEEDWWSPGA